MSQRHSESQATSSISSPKTNPEAALLEPRIGCIASAMEIIGNKWTAVLLRDLTAGPKRFGELEKSMHGISPRTLSQRLDNLEAQKIITRKSYAEVPPRCEYRLTAKGDDLVPILKQMAVWGEKYYSDTGAADC